MQTTEEGTMKNKLELQLPGVSRSGWELDGAAVREACELLGLTRPVRVRYTAGYCRVGCYRYRGGEHHITLSGLLDAGRAGEVLWHELAHAMQRDRTGSAEAVAAQHASNRKVFGYMASPHEVEARSYESFNDDLPLARKPRSSQRTWKAPA